MSFWEVFVKDLDEYMKYFGMFSYQSGCGNGITLASADNEQIDELYLDVTE